jgi:predicted dehydrogenase
MDSFSRRGFLGAATTLAAGSYSQIKGANERLRIGVIGCGGMATHHMTSLMKVREAGNFDIVNVCDIYTKRVENAAKITGAKIVKDYRRLLDNQDIDYVLIATPEHWHYQMTMDAAAAGKHIYCEKPMTQTVEQSKRVVERIKQTGVKMQVGVQGMSDDSYEAALKYVKDGVLGNVVIAQIDYSRNHTNEGMWAYPIDNDARPGENLDWNAWLGKAPKRAWDPDRYFRWRRYWDYSGGISTDLFIHRVTRVIKALGLTFPERAVGSGGIFQFKDVKGEVPDTFNIMLEYPGGPQVLLVSSMANDTPVEHVLRGHKATLVFTRTGFTIKPQGLFAKDMKEITFQKSGREEVVLHHKNLQAAIRHNEPLKCGTMLGYYAVVACAMGVESFRKRKYLKWDKAKERIVHA